MSSLEGFKEFLEDLILSFLSGNDFWVLVGLVNASDIVDVDPAVAILIKLLESLHDNLLSGWVHGTSDGSNELIV